jgi:release factor glutamine methyltransferase
MESWTISKTLDWTTEYFKKFNIEWPHLEAEILLAHALALKRIELYTHHERILTEEELGRFKGLIQRRSQHEPIAYITGTQPFMSIEFFVDRSVLIPRPETEQLVEVAIDSLKRSSSPTPRPTVVDIGTGCGVIAVSLAKFIPHAKIIGIDSSDQAVKIAQRNADHHKVSNKCQFIQGNMFAPLKEKVDMIISNPPYIPTDVIGTLDTDVKDWEPREALDGGKDGLDYIRKIITKAYDHLNSDGLLLVEIDHDQGQRAKDNAEKSEKYKKIKIFKDLNNKDRILKATKT